MTAETSPDVMREQMRRTLRQPSAGRGIVDVLRPERPHARPLTGAAKNAHASRVLIDEAREAMAANFPPEAVETLLTVAYVKAPPRARRKLDAEGHAIITGVTR